jgi:fructosamine-3-kinase
MLTAKLKHHLEERFSLNITSATPLSGGDINEVYLLKGEKKKRVIKINQVEVLPDLFQKEASGLGALRAANAIDIPEVFGYGDFGTNTYILMEYKASGEVTQKFWELFGQQLAALHQHTEKPFGFKEDNYLGSLEQFNDRTETASEFYILQRLVPQFKMAAEKGYKFEKLEAFYARIEQLIPDEPSSLIHGDLWSGNYLVNSENKPCLIDPAVAYAPREMDLAMMKLFGGFDKSLFRAYQDVFPLQNDWEHRIKLWQLYYILAHLNLFGGAYYDQANHIISYFR